MIALLGGELKGCWFIVIELDRAIALDRDVIVAGRAFDVVEFELHIAAVAGAQETRQRCGQHHRIAHNDVARGFADLVLAPGDRHDAYGACEGRDVEAHLRGAVGADADNAGIERERRLRRWRAGQFGAAVAARTDRPAHALHAVDQLPIEIADFCGELALTEIILVGRRRLVICEIEDADIDRGDDHMRLLAGSKPCKLDRYIKRIVGPHGGRQLHIERERALRTVDREPLHADGAPRHTLRRGIERTTQGRDQIGAGAPALADGERHGHRPRFDVLRDRRHQAVGEHVEREAAGGAHGHRNVHGVAGFKVVLVERDLQQIGRIGT